MAYDSPIHPETATAVSGVAAVPASRREFGFSELWGSGYRDLHPILPHDATLTKDCQIPDKDRGKAPGLPRDDHTWHGFPDWRNYTTTEADCQLWDRLQCGVGIRCKEVLGFDIDVTHPILAPYFEQAMLRHLPPTLRRIGQSPKVLYVYRCPPATRGFKIRFSTPAHGGPFLVEVLCEGRQFVASGVHPVTKQLYQWPDGSLPEFPLDMLPTATQEKIDAAEKEIRQVIAELGGTILKENKDGNLEPESVDQASLIASDLGDFAEIVRQMPHDGCLDGYDPWIDWIRGVLGGFGPDHREQAEALVIEHAQRWHLIGTMDKHGRLITVESAMAEARLKLDSMKPPHRLGADYVLRIAREVGVPGAAGFGFTAEDAPEQDRRALADAFNPPPAPSPPDRNALLEFMDINAWANRDIQPPDRLLGDFITTTSRAFLVGRTGLGKTQMAVGMAAGIATGAGFLHWQASRKGRVLLIDGEMSAAVIKSRMKDAIRRCGGTIEPGAFWIYAMDLVEEFAAAFPGLGRMAPLNTAEGHRFVLKLVDIIKPDVVIFDNVMSLIGGDKKEEVPWTETLPLVLALTRKRAGQLWLDHTGHNTDRQYGSSTKAWMFDGVALMTPISDNEKTVEWETAFRLSFDHPGKARMRGPDNWPDFREVVVRLTGDNWSWEAAKKAAKKESVKLTPTREAWFRDIRDIFNEPHPELAGQELGPESLSGGAGRVRITLTRETIREGLRKRDRLPHGNLTDKDRTKLREILNTLVDKGKLERAEGGFRMGESA